MASDFWGYVGRCQRQASSYVEKSLASFTELNPDADAGTLLDYASQVLYQAVTDYGDRAAAAACSAYDSTMESLGISTAAADMYEALTEQGATALVQSDYLQSRTTSRLISSLRDTASAKVREGANRTLSTNADRDYSSGVRWARVPTGAETCGFCVTMASRGFVYHTAESAGNYMNRYHRGCDCKVVVGTEDTVVDGYDPDWYYACYRDARETVLGDASYNVDEPEGKSLFDAMCAELTNRSRAWVYGEEAASVSYGTKALSSSTKMAAEALSAHGIEVETADEGSATDVKANGRWWSVLDPSEDDVEALIDEARGNWADADADGRYVILSERSKDVDGGFTDEQRAEYDAVSALLQQGEQALVISGDGMTLRRLSG